MEDFKAMGFGLARVFVYALVAAGMFGAIQFSVSSENAVGGAFRENSWLEWLQITLLVAVVAVLATCTGRAAPLRQCAILMAAFAMAALVRENDSLLDQVHKEAWEVLVLACLVPAGINAWRNRSRLEAELRVFTPMLAFGVFLCAFATIFVFSRLYGMSVFWEGVMQDQFQRTVKNVSEEGIELYGYGLLLVAAVEFALLNRWLERRRDGGSAHADAGIAG